MNKTESKENCIIVGAGTYGQIYAQYLKEDYDVVGFIDDNPKIVNTEIDGIEVLGDSEFLFRELDRTLSVFAPIGNNEARVYLLKRLMETGFKTPNYIHAQTHIHDSVIIGKCVYILPGTCIMPLTVVEDFVLISMGVNIAHHTTIGEGSFLSQGTDIGAGIELKKNVFCGIGSTVMTGVTEVGEGALIGAAAAVIKNVPDRAVVVGNPGKVIKYRQCS